MFTNDFSLISSRYEQDSVIQRSAADRLLGLLDIGHNDDVLDLGCGTGGLTRKIRAITTGRVVGIDPSTGMISEALSCQQVSNVSFEVRTAEHLDYQNEFSTIFCNSAFQWFLKPGKSLKNCYAALRPGGRMGIQAPAKKAYCPNFLAAIDEVAMNRRTAPVYSSFRPPWFFLETAHAYAALFKKAGFSVPFARIETISTLHPPGEVMAIFESGAAAGYLNQGYYSTTLDAAYTTSFREIVKESFQHQANTQGHVELIFNRIYLIAVK